MAVIVNGDGILTGISSLATALTDLTSGRGTVTGVATVGTLQLGAGVSISSPRSQQAAIFTNNTEFFTVDDAGRVGVGTITPNSDAHPENEKKINVGFITARSVAGDIDANTLVVAGISTFIDGTKIANSGVTANKISLPDSSDGSLNIGVGSDFKLNHDGTHSYLTEVGGGNLYIQGSNIIIRDAGTLEKHIEMTQNGSVDLYHNGVKRIETSSSGGTLTGDFTVTGNIYGGNHITIGDSDGSGDMLKIGASEDIRIYHYNNNSYIRQHTDLPLVIGGTSTGQSLYLQPKSGENSAIFKPNAEVELYHDNVLVFKTTGAGIQVQAPEGSAAAINLYSDEGDDNADMWRIINNGSNFLKWQTYQSGSWQDAISAQGENQVRLFYNGSEKLNTGNHGISITGKIYMNNGNLQFASSSNGIDFSATSDASGMTSELLDDYEEGTFTPIVADSGSGGNTASSYTTNIGWYTKIGNIVNIQIRLRDVNQGSISGSSVIYIRGFPYAMEQRTNALVVGHTNTSRFNVPANCYELSALSNNGSSTPTWCRLFASIDNAEHGVQLFDSISATNQIQINMTYRVA